MLGCTWLSLGLGIEAAEYARLTRLASGKTLSPVNFIACKMWRTVVPSCLDPVGEPDCAARRVKWD